jgi:4-amino-4-deoxy-L-arabinose transferase-like glycosyltransferase
VSEQGRDKSNAAWILLLALLGVRGLMAGLLPITADEAYYWLWSRHLDLGYLDHPPMIAWLIRAGTLIFGDTFFGVRFSGLVLSGLASFFVWESARLLLKDEVRAVTAALLFNLTLMANVEMLAATPDMPSIATSAALLFCLARLQQSGEGKYWLWAGLAAGLGLLSKYSALFLIAGAFLWLLLSPRNRPEADAPKQKEWLRTLWPWLGALLALLIFLPHLIWQQSHSWETFRFQFSRVAGHQLTARFIFEFLGAQLGLASPFIFILGVMGLWRARPHGDQSDSDLFLPAILIWPALAYFFIHALHDRVQGNWPCFLYPAFSILAVSAFAPSGWRKWSARLAVPVAGFFLVLAYAQALTGFIPLGARDPLPRLLGVGVRPMAASLADTVKQNLAAAILTTDYESTAWLRFYQPGLKVIQVGETERYPNAPAPDAALLKEPLLYVAERRRDQSAELRNYFSTVLLGPEISMACRGCAENQPFALYEIYSVEGPKAPLPGRMP